MGATLRGAGACRRAAYSRRTGKDVGDILISEKLAVPFKCSDNPMPKPWCS